MGVKAWEDKEMAKRENNPKERLGVLIDWKTISMFNIDNILWSFEHSNNVQSFQMLSSSSNHVCVHTHTHTHTHGCMHTWNDIQFSSVTQSCLTLCNPMNHSTPGLPVHHQLPEFTQIHIHRVSDAIQPSHPRSSSSPPAPSPSKHQSLFLWVNSSHEVAKVLELQL